MGLQINQLSGEIDVDQSTAGTYQVTRTVTNSNDPNNPSTATDIVVINDADNASFSYSGSPFDINNASNPTPTITGLSGGTFSSISSFDFHSTADHYIDVANGLTFTNSGAQSTISFWLNTSSSSYQTIIDFGPGTGKGISASAGGFNIEPNFTSNTYTIYRDGQVVRTAGSSKGSSEFLSDGNWHNYIISDLRCSQTITEALIGAAKGTPPFLGFDGKMSSLVLWNTVISSASDIANIYNNGSPQSNYNNTPDTWYKMGNDATYNSSTGTWSIPNAANPGTADGTSTTLSSDALQYLDINSSTGLISLSTSNIGTYSVSYNTTGATGSLCPATSTQSVQLVNTNFNFPSNVCNATGSPDIVPTNFISGQGGSFSMTPSSGLAINNNSSSANFGTISPAGSTAGTYAITYTIGSNSTTKNVTSDAVLAPSTTTNTSALSFNGTSSYITSSYSGNVSALSLWFKPNSAITASSSAQYIINFGGTWNGIGFGGFTSALTNELIVVTDANIAGRSAYTSSGSISVDWHHLLINWSGSVYEIWLDGTNVQNATTGTPTLINASSIEIGRRSTSPNYYFNGEIDEVAVWDTNLTSCDIAGIYQASSNGITADLSTVYSNNLKYYNRMGD
mgnify:CR=1 FL=1